jgi:medium-chain acyl-[acyl-carrier-protein] hydrolase
VLDLHLTQFNKVIFFGHSLGGLIAYELALKLQSKNGLNLAHLFVSSANNPDFLTLKNQKCTKKFHLMSDATLFQEILDLGGVPAGILILLDSIVSLIHIYWLDGTLGVHLDLLRHSLPAIRGDYEALETYSRLSWENRDGNTISGEAENGPEQQSHLLLNCPISSFGGEDDIDISPESLQGWEAFSSNTFSYHSFPGGHFYFMNQNTFESVCQTISDIVLN